MGALEDLQDKLQLKEIEFKSLLEYFQALNGIDREDKLLKNFVFTLIGLYKLEKLAICIKDKASALWHTEITYPFVRKEPASEIEDLLEKYGKEKQVLFISGKTKKSYDYVVPIVQDDFNEVIIFVKGVKAKGLNNINEQLRFVQTIGNITLSAVLNHRNQKRFIEQEVYKKELAIAQQVQSLLFPKSLPTSSDICITANYFPHHFVGGDYYDYLKLGEHQHLVCLGDVSGKGISAALLMSNVQACVRIMGISNPSLVPIVKGINEMLYQNTGGDKFITLFIALIDTKKNKIKYINAGHNPPLFLNGKTDQYLEASTTLLGIFSQLPVIEEIEMNYTSKDTLFLYTDGLTDALMDDEQKAFALVRKYYHEGQMDALHASLYGLAQHNLMDDITLLSIQL